MIHTDFAGAIRRTMMAVLGADAHQEATISRPPKNPFDEAAPEPRGTITGYRYMRKHADAAVLLGLPGELDVRSEWFMELTSASVPIEPGDLMTFANGDVRRVSLTSGSGGFTGAVPEFSIQPSAVCFADLETRRVSNLGRDIYRLYKLEVV